MVASSPAVDGEAESLAVGDPQIEEAAAVGGAGGGGSGKIDPITALQDGIGMLLRDGHDRQPAE